MTPFKLRPLNAPRQQAFQSSPSFAETVAAGVRQESAFFSPLDIFQRANIPADPDFALDEFFSRRPELLPYQEHFDRAESETEARVIEKQIRAEEERRALLESAGFAGFTSQMVGAVLSPSTFVPVGGALRGVRGVARLGALAGAGAALDEVVLQAGQVTREAKESALNVVASAALGTVLGTAIAGLQPREMGAAVRHHLRETTASVAPPAINDGSVSAARTLPSPTDPGQLTGVLGAEELDSASIFARMHNRAMRGLGQTSPVVRNLLSDVPAVRAWQARMATAELDLKADEAVAPGGNIERRIAYKHRSYTQTALDVLDEGYTKYRYQKPKVTQFDRMRAEVGGVLPQRGGRLKRVEFEARVHQELHDPQQNQLPEVQEVANRLRSELFIPLGKELQQLGLISKEIDVENAHYVNWLYDKDEVVRRAQAFEEMLIRNYQRRFTEAFFSRKERVAAADTRAEQDIQTLSMSDAEAAARQDVIERERAAFAESEAADIRTEMVNLDREIRDIEKVIAEGTSPNRITMGREAIAELKARRKALDDLLDEEDREALKRDNRLRRESTLLSQSIGRLEARQAKALAQLEKNEEQAVGVIRRLQKKMVEFDKDMASLSDEEYARGLRELEADFNQALARLEKIEDRIAKLNADNPEFETGPATWERRIQRFRREILPAGKFVLENEADRADALRRIDEAISSGTTLDGNTLTPQQARSLETLREDIAGARLRDAGDIEAAFSRAWRLEGETDSLRGKLDRVAGLLEDASQEGPEFARGILREFHGDLLREVSDRLHKKSLRREKLRRKAVKLDPEKSRERIRELEEGIIRRKDSASEWVRLHGGELKSDGTPDFAEGGKDFAREMRQRIEGDPTRMPAFAVMPGPRGALLQRVLDLKYDEASPFLVREMDKLVRIYTRNAVPDMELVRAGAGVRGEKIQEDVRQAYAKLFDEAQTEVEAKNPIGENETQEAYAERVKGLLAKKNEKLKRQMDRTLKNFEGQIERMRHIIRGIPDDPDTFLYRAGRFMQSYNTARLMGNVLLASVADVAVAVNRYGFRNIWRHALRPMLRGMPEYKLSRREALYYGLNELMSQDRFYQIADLMEGATRRNRFEKGIDYLANRIGVVGLFSYWNQIMKTALAPVATGRMLDALEVFMTGSGHMPIAEARHVLASMQISPELARRIWEQQKVGGLVKTENGLWVPNTQSWTDREAVDAFRTAVLAEMDVAINTPGVERPLFVDKNLGFKLLTQFQSFMWSSHIKILFASLQAPDLKLLQGLTVATGLGAISYYMDMFARGRASEIKNHTWEDWADNILYRSPFLGVFAGVQRIGQSIPATRPYVQFSDEGAQIRRYGLSPVESVAGPTFGTAKTLGDLVVGLDEPTKSTVNTARQLMPYQNVVYLRWLFGQVAESAASGLPERRD